MKQIYKLPRNKTKMKQKAFDYCMYMMLTSYWKRVEMEHHIQEKKLFITYQELKEEEQIQMEKQALHLIETDILSQIPEEMLQMPIEVRLTQLPNSDQTQITLESYVYKVSVLSLYQKQKKPISFTRVARYRDPS